MITATMVLAAVLSYVLWESLDKINETLKSILQLMQDHYQP
jgi:hypothetical protein